jgi:hypothetical protein
LKQSEGVKGEQQMNTQTLKDRGITVDVSKMAPAVTVELFGHVTLVEGYALTNFNGCHALIALRDMPGKTVAVLTSQHRLQTLLETGLSTGNLVAFFGQKLTNPPTPRGGTWGVDVYGIDGIILYSMK